MINVLKKLKGVAQQLIVSLGFLAYAKMKNLVERSEVFSLSLRDVYEFKATSIRNI